MIVKKHFVFCAAHRLTFHSGKCFNLHGHNYNLIVGVKGEKNNDMLIDFYDLSKIVNANIIDLIDHSCIVFEKDFKLKEFLEKNNFKKYLIPFESTVENISIHFKNILEQKLKTEITIELYETEKCLAIV